MKKLGKIGYMLVAGLMAVASAPAAASSGSTSVASASAEVSNKSANGAKSADSKKICVSLEAITGSRMSKRSCKTKAEWAVEGVELSSRQ